jgi:hypothetical protein
MSKRVRTIDIESLRERARQKTVSDPLDLVNIQERLTNSAYKAYLFIMSQWMSSVPLYKRRISLCLLPASDFPRKSF